MVNYTSTPPSGGTDVTLAGTLAGGAVPQLVAGSYVILSTTASGTISLGTDGVLTNTGPNAATVTLYQFDEATSQYLIISATVAGAGGGTGALTVDGDIYAGKLITVTTDVNLAATPDVSLNINGQLLAATITQVNPGIVTVPFPLDKAGLRIETGVSISLEITGGSSIAAGTGDLTVRPGGVLHGQPSELLGGQLPGVSVNGQLVEQIEQHDTNGGTVEYVNGVAINTGTGPDIQFYDVYYNGSWQTLSATIPVFAELFAYDVTAADDTKWVIDSNAHTGITTGSVGSHAWVEESAVAGSIGGSYMRALPINGTLQSQGTDIGLSLHPLMVYRIYSATAQTVYAWVKMWASDNSENSAWMGFEEPYLNANYGPPQSAWLWDMVGPLSAIEGDNELKVGMREDGTIIDGIILTTDAAYDPRLDPAAADALFGAPSVLIDSTTPVITSTQGAEMAVRGGPHEIAAGAYTDAGNQMGTWSATLDGAALPEGYAINPATGAIQLDGTQDSGVYSIVRSVSDGTNTAQETFALTIVDNIGTEQAVSLIKPVGAFVWESPYQEMSGQAWEGMGTCVKQVNLGQESIVMNTRDQLTADTVLAAVIISNPRPNDNTLPALFFNGDVNNALFLTLAADTDGNPRRIEFKERVNGVDRNVTYALASVPLATGTKVALEYNKVTGLIRIRVNGAVIAVIPSSVHRNAMYFADGMIAQSNDMGVGCVSAIGSSGFEPLRISMLNGNVGIASIIPGVNTLQFSGDYAPPTVRVADVFGIFTEVPASQTNASTVTFTPDMTELYKGPVVVSTPNGLERNANYGAPTGFKVTKFGAVVSTPMGTANWGANGQVTVPTHTIEGNPITVLENGHVEIDGGAMPQSVMIAFNDGTGYGAAVREWFYPREIEAAIPVQLFAGNAVNIDLSTLYPVLGVPESEQGSSGAGWSIATPGGLPAGLTLAGDMLTGALPDGLTEVDLEITLPDGRTLPTTLQINMQVIDAELGTLAIEVETQIADPSVLPMADPGSMVIAAVTTMADPSARPEVAIGGMAVVTAMTAPVPEERPVIPIGGMAVVVTMTPPTPAVAADEKLISAGERLAIQIY